MLRVPRLRLEPLRQRACLLPDIAIHPVVDSNPLVEIAGRPNTFAEHGEPKA
jgi:hypothetical protein